jgi:hypothetical protein
MTASLTADGGYGRVFEKPRRADSRRRVGVAVARLGRGWARRVGRVRGGVGVAGGCRGWSGGAGAADADLGGGGVGGCGPAAGKPRRALVLRSRWRWRSTWTRRRARAARMRSRAAWARRRGRPAVAASARTEATAARRAAVKEISRGWTGRPARGPGGVFLGDHVGGLGAEHGAGGRAGAVQGGLVLFREVSEPIQRQW